MNNLFNKNSFHSINIFNNEINYDKQQLYSSVIVDTKYADIKKVDFILERVLTGFIYERTLEKRIVKIKIDVTTRKPKFIEWLFKKPIIVEKEIEIPINIKDLLINPPKENVGNLRIYTIGNNNGEQKETN